MAAPLFFSGDMARLDEFTLNVLCNPEVIDVNQDALGKQATPVRFTDEDLVLAKANGRWLAGGWPVQLGRSTARDERDVERVGADGRHRVRDVWRHQDLGEFDETYSTKVNRHGVAMLRMFPTTN